MHMRVRKISEMLAGFVLPMLLYTVLWSQPAMAKDVFASSAHLKVLADGERNLIESLHRYIESEIDRLDQIDSLLNEIRSVHNNFPRSSRSSATDNELTANPLHAFHLIKRFATTWRNVWALASNFTAYEVLKTTSESLVDHLPTDSDLGSAMWSLVRLQKTYDLPINELIHGHIAGYEAPPLGHLISFELAIMCLGYGEPDEAIKWLTHAYNVANGNYASFIDNDALLMVPLSAIYQAFGRAYAQKQDYVTAVDYIHKAVEADPSNGGLLVDILPPPQLKIPITTEEPEWRRNYFQLCQKAAYPETFQTHLNSTQHEQLECRYQLSRYVPFQRFKVEFLHRSPDVVLFHDFVSNNESDKLKELAVSQIVRAKIGSSMDSTESEARVGKITWMYDKDDEITRKISQRVGDVTGLNVTFPTSEPLQLSNYGLGGHYEPHFDHDEHRYDREQQPPEVVENGDRIATLMIYLNDVTVGGATVFTKLNLAARPVKNAAIFWYNYNRSGSMESLSLHAACPVLIGEKWVANKWIREYGQEFARPCGLTEEAPSEHKVFLTSIGR